MQEVSHIPRPPAPEADMACSILLRNATVLIHSTDDHVSPHANMDILITNDIIADIGSNLVTPNNAKVIDCAGKIVTPGFVDCHHHLWQTQLKGRYADHQLLEYMVDGNIRSYNYTPRDIYWGQLSGCLEALDVGTTTVVDHSHGSYTPSHADAVLSATITSGLRTILAFSPIATIRSWTQTECVGSGELTLHWVLDYVEDLLRRTSANSDGGFEGRVAIGFAFDLFFLPKDFVISIYQRMREAGSHLITTHLSRDLVIGKASTTHLMNEYGLLGRDILMSHATGIDEDEKKILHEKGVYLSSTPETECQMALGCPVALDDGVRGCLGVDCHANNSSSMLSQARTLLQVARFRDSERKNQQDRYPKKIVGDTERAFNLATIEGARAVGLEEQIGSVAKGKKADLIVWEWQDSVSMLGCADPMVAVVRHSDTRDVAYVIVNGRVVKEQGKLCGVTVDGEIAGLGRGKIDMAWTDVAGELRRSRDNIVHKIEQGSVEKAKEMVVAMYRVDEAKFV